MKLVLILGLLILLGCVLVGCAAKKPVSPQLEARHCASGSWPIRAWYHGQLVDVCGVADPECVAKHPASCVGEQCAPFDCPVVDVILVGAPNTYLDPDADEAEKDRPKVKTKRVWWKFWEGRNHEKTPDRD
jgi:hypothetical protein